MLPICSVTVASFMFASLAPQALAYGNDEPPFDEASIFFELNDTDGDLGIHAFIDGDPWKKLTIEDPRDRNMLKIKVKGRLRNQGLTELFFESAEPSFDELLPADFFERFPAGEYDIEGVTLEGEDLESTVILSHVMPAPADNMMVAGQMAAEDCDADELPSVEGGESVVISWDPVNSSHPDIGEWGDVEVVKYQAVVEREEPTLLIFSVDLPPSVTQIEVPASFIALGDEFKFEVLVREASGNQTAVESCFEVE